MSQKLIIFVTSKQVKIVTNMEEEDKDVERILEIIKSEQLNASAFAEKIGVQKSSVSHVISGRNKPSKEFMVKILRTFPEISSDWLFLGLGDMYRVPKQPAQEQPAADLLSAQMSAPQPSAQPQQSGQSLQTTLLFSDTNAEPVNAEPAKPQPVAVETPKPQQPKTQKVAQAEPQIKTQTSENKEIKQSATKPEPVDQPAPAQPKVQTQQPEPVNIMKTDPEKIIVFYSNKTFTLYSPSGE